MLGHEAFVSTTGARGDLCSILSVTAKFGIFLFYMIIAFKKIWVEFPDMVIFFCTGPNPRWPTVAILEKT